MGMKRQHMSPVTCATGRYDVEERPGALKFHQVGGKLSPGERLSRRIAGLHQRYVPAGKLGVMAGPLPTDRPGILLG